MAPIDLKDDSAIAIIGSGAGGGTLAHELTSRGMKVVLLEAGKRQSTESFSQVPGEAFAQLTWLDVRTQSGTWGVERPEDVDLFEVQLLTPALVRHRCDADTVVELEDRIYRDLEEIRALCGSGRYVDLDAATTMKARAAHRARR